MVKHTARTDTSHVNCGEQPFRDDSAMTLSIDLSTLPLPAQKILDPAGPAPLKKMAARGVVPGLKPGETITVVVLLSQGEGEDANAAKATLAKLPPPLLNGALGGNLPAGTLHAIAPFFVSNAEVAQKILSHAAIDPETVELFASLGNEAVTELVATNEERLLRHASIIEKLYLNKSTRMSTADRILELAVRNKLELTGIPAFKEAATAIRDELISEPTEEPTFDDVQFNACADASTNVGLSADEDTHERDETGEEKPVEKMRPLLEVWNELRAPAKIRLVTLGTFEADGDRYDGTAIRLLGVRDSNPLVAVAAIKSPSIKEDEIRKISASRNVSEDVLRIIANNKDWTRNHTVKINLVRNPRTPFGLASKWIQHLRENELKDIGRSREVPAAIAMAARQQLQRKGK